MYEVAIAVLVTVILCLIFAMVLLSNTNRRQEKTIGDLLDRLAAPDFQTYAIARERKQEIEMADKGLRQVVEEYGDQDSFRIE
ncbi:MAG: hypothetical protein WC248_08410 [Candidatus Methanomethylophilaceae archaeon]|jgi:hypothetical protein